jgi:tRNA pseudouridine13 synthase
VKHASGGVFYELDAAVLQPRLDAHEVSITGPLFGDRMRWPQGEARAFEEALLAEELADPRVLKTWKKLLPGARRPYRLLPGPIGVSPHPAGLRVCFTLPAGAYATVVLRELCKTDVAPGVPIGQDTGGPDDEMAPTPEDIPPP